MKTIQIKKVGLGLLILLAIALLLAFTVFAKEEKEIALKDTPAVVKTTIEKQANGKTVEEIEVRTKDGKTVYEVKIKDEGKEKCFLVDSEGKFLGYGEIDEDEEDEENEGKEENEVEVGIQDLPQAVKTSAEKYLGDLKSAEAKKEVEDEKTVFEIEVKKDGVEMTAEFKETGEIIELEKEIKVSQLPQSVVSSIKATYPNSKIKEADEKQSFENNGEKISISYDVEIISEIEFSADGKVVNNKK